MVQLTPNDIALFKEFEDVLTTASNLHLDVYEEAEEATSYQAPTITLSLDEVEAFLREQVSKGNITPSDSQNLIIEFRGETWREFYKEYIHNQSLELDHRTNKVMTTHGDLESKIYNYTESRTQSFIKYMDMNTKSDHLTMLEATEYIPATPMETLEVIIRSLGSLTDGTFSARDTLFIDFVDDTTGTAEVMHELLDDYVSTLIRVQEYIEAYKEQYSKAFKAREALEDIEDRQLSIFNDWIDATAGEGEAYTLD